MLDQSAQMFLLERELREQQLDLVNQFYKSREEQKYAPVATIEPVKLWMVDSNVGLYRQYGFDWLQKDVLTFARSNSNAVQKIQYIESDTLHRIPYTYLGLFLGYPASQSQISFMSFLQNVVRDQGLINFYNDQVGPDVETYFNYLPGDEARYSYLQLKEDIKTIKRELQSPDGRRLQNEIRTNILYDKQNQEGFKELNPRQLDLNRLAPAAISSVLDNMKYFEIDKFKERPLSDAEKVYIENQGHQLWKDTNDMIDNYKPLLIKQVNDGVPGAQKRMQILDDLTGVKNQPYNDFFSIGFISFGIQVLITMADVAWWKYNTFDIWRESLRGNHIEGTVPSPEIPYSSYQPFKEFKDARKFRQQTIGDL